MYTGMCSILCQMTANCSHNGNGKFSMLLTNSNKAEEFIPTLLMLPENLFYQAHNVCLQA